MTNITKVIQLLITLNDVHPQIWRRIVVSEKSTLYDLHLITQIAMGWTNSHLHDFEINGKTYSDPQFFEMAEEKPISEKRTFLKNLKLNTGDQFSYTYDYGDDWAHTITVEEISLPQENKIYPLCLDGEYACPLEDSGGPFAYETLLQALKEGNPEQFDLFMDDEQFYVLLEDFDPNVFNKKKVNKSLATEGEILAGKDDKKKAANKTHKEFLVEEFVEEIYDKFSLPDVNDEFKRFCLDHPLRKDIIVIMNYLMNNKVVGTKATGNFPLKAVAGICAQFDTPISMDPLDGDVQYPVRSEDDIFRLELLHFFANVAGLIVGDNGIKWEVTVLGKAFLEVTPTHQMMELFYEWFNNFVWTFLFPLQFSSSDEYTQFIITTIFNLLYLPIDKFVPFNKFVDQVYEANEAVFINYVENNTGNLFEEGRCFIDQEEIRKGKLEMAREVAITVTEQMIILPMIDFGVLEAIPISKKNSLDEKADFSAISLTESGNILLEGLWNIFNRQSDGKQK